MRKLVLVWLGLCLTLGIYAEYAPQSIIFTSTDDIKVSEQYPDSVATDCAWFNDLSSQYRIHYLEKLYEYSDSPNDKYCYYLRYKDSMEVDDMLDVFTSEIKVTIAEADMYLEPFGDPMEGDQWYLSKIGMDLVSANYNYAGGNILVGVVDSGIDLGLNLIPPGNPHPDLLNNLYTDSFGSHGYNALSVVFPSQSSFNVQDYLGHGTHVAGIIGAVTNNNVGISGIVGGDSENSIQGSKIYSVKIGGTFTSERYYTSAFLRGIRVATQDGVRIFNCSFGLVENLDQVNRLIANVSNYQDQSLFICAAGNGTLETTVTPASNPNCISVAATTQDDVITEYSNYHDSVDICAPGGPRGHGDENGILSTMPQDSLFFYHTQKGYAKNYEFASGTSMAAPMVTAAVVLVKQAFPNLTMQQIKARILGTADDVYRYNDISLAGKLGSGRLNVYKAISTERPHMTLRLQNVNVDNDSYIVCDQDSMSLNVTLKNWWASNPDPVTGTISTTDPNIMVLQDSLEFICNTVQGDERFDATFLINDSSEIYTDALFKLVVNCGTYCDTLYFKIPKRANTDLFKINIPNRTAVSQAIVDDIDNDGMDEMAFISTNNNNNSYLNMLRGGYVNEILLPNHTTCKPAFADVDYNGELETIIVDNMGNITVFGINMNVIASINHEILADSIQSFVVEDINNDGQLDLVINSLLGAQSSIHVIKLMGYFEYSVTTYQLDAGWKLISPLAIGDVDSEVDKNILFIRSNYDPSNHVTISTQLTKLTYCDAKGGFFKVSDYEVDNQEWNNDILRYYGCTEIILARTNPEEYAAPFDLIYFGIGFTQVSGSPTIDGTLGYYKLYCMQFEGDATIVWSHAMNDNSQNYNYITQKAYNIIAGDFISDNQGLEIIAGATEEVLDADTGEFIQYLTNNTRMDGMHINNHYQPAVITDVVTPRIMDVFVHHENHIIGFDEDKSISQYFQTTLPSGNNVMSLVAGNARIIDTHDLYAITTINGSTRVYYIPIVSNNQSLMYQWRQMGNNARLSCVYQQPIPSAIDAHLIVWNNCEVDNDIHIKQDAVVDIVAGVNIRMRYGSSITCSGSIGFDRRYQVPVTIKGLCPKFVTGYWDGITLLNLSEPALEYLEISNATSALELFDLGEYGLNYCKFIDNQSGIIVYNSIVDSRGSSYSNGGVGIKVLNSGVFNASGTYGVNNIENNEIGIFTDNSYPNLTEGFNSIDNTGYNIYINDISIGIEAKYNWWGDAYEPAFIDKFNCPYMVEYSYWLEQPYVAKGQDANNEGFFYAEDLRSSMQWFQAIQIYQTICNDPSDPFRYPAARAMMQCYMKLNDGQGYISWLTQSIVTCNDTDYILYLNKLKALTKRALHQYQEALDYYETILENNPSYADSCYAIIDIGFTWLESNNNLQSKRQSLRPCSVQSHLSTTRALLSSIQNNTVLGSDIVPAKEVILNQNYPNPFNPSTTISYFLPEKTDTDIKIYNVKGQLVRTYRNLGQERGIQKIVWDGRDKKGTTVASGVYFYKLDTNDATIIKKCLLLK